MHFEGCMLCRALPGPDVLEPLALNMLTRGRQTIRGVAAIFGLCRSTLALWATRDPVIWETRRLRERIVDLEEELEFVKKSAVVLGGTTREKYAYIHARASVHSVVFMCRCLDVSRSGYYNWLSRGVSEHERRDIELCELIEQVHEASRGLYGSPRIHAELIARGVRVSRKRIARLMRRLGIRAVRPKRFVVTTLSEHDRRIAPDLLEREFAVDAPNRVWVSDLTYVWTDEGWLYLTVVLDLYARRVVGWSAADHMRDDLVMMALNDAFERRGDKTGFEGLIFHSDRGSQYASDDIIEALEARGIRRSMSPKGDCWSNGVAESFFGTLKKELIYREDYTSRQMAIESISEYIELFYNAVRRHSTNDYVSPVAKENMI